METILIIIKLEDNIFIPKSAASKIFLGKDYFKAQRILYDLGRVSTPNPEGFIRFFEKFTELFPDKKLFSLYCLADKVSYTKNGQSDENFLNYFAFEQQIDNTTPNLGLTTAFGASGLMALSFSTKLEKLLALEEINYWWFEGKMSLMLPNAPSRCTEKNTFYNVLRFADFSGKGKNVKLFDAEDYGTLDIKHPYLSKIEKTKVNLSNTPDENVKAHFYKTLGIIFAQMPERISKKVVGIAPQAQLGILAFTIPKKISKSFVRTNGEEFALVDNFIQRAINAHLFKSSIMGKGEVVLFERQVTLFVGNNITQNFPLEVLPDMRRAYLNCAKNDIIVVQPAGQNVIDTTGLRNPNLEAAANNIMDTHKAKIRFYNFSDRSATILVGAIDKDGKILKHNDTDNMDTNHGPMVDAYLWGECVESLDTGQGVADYGHTSAASAIMAGIVVALQSKAKSVGKKLNTGQLKAVFARTFRKEEQIFVPTTIDVLWQECKKELGIPQNI